MTDFVDLRSDTVTRPCDAMRAAMAAAEVGDDVFDDDPTVNRLQEAAAARMGKEAGLFVASGTMGNAVALLTHLRAGQEVLLDADAHSMLYEVGLPAAVAHAVTRQFRSRDGVPDLDDVAANIHAETLHGPGTALIVLENTHNRAGGTIIPIATHRAVETLARAHGASVHLDGARLFNAAVASGVSAAEYAAHADSVTFCLSKGLGCPVGSVLCGTAEFIGRARRNRKMLGGGMRQAGILAAAGLYALHHNVDRLADDHARARTLAEGLAGTPGAEPEHAHPATNMVYLRTAAPASEFTARMRDAHGVLAVPMAAHRLRLVTHLDVDDAGIERAVAAVRATAASGAAHAHAARA